MSKQQTIAGTRLPAGGRYVQKTAVQNKLHQILSVATQANNACLSSRQELALNGDAAAAHAELMRARRLVEHLDDQVDRGLEALEEFAPEINGALPDQDKPIPYQLVKESA